MRSADDQIISKLVGGASEKPIPSAPKKIEPKGGQGDAGGHTSSLLEAKKAEAIASSTITAPSLDDALVKLGPEMDRFADTLGAKNASGNSALFYTGAVVGGIGVIAALAGVGLVAAAEYTLETKDSKPTDKQQALDDRPVSFGMLIGGAAASSIADELTRAVPVPL